MKKIFLLMLLAFWNAGQCFSLLDNPENWEAEASFSYSLDGNAWTKATTGIVSPLSGETFYLKVEVYVITDYAFDNMKTRVPLTLNLDIENGCNNVVVKSGNGEKFFNWIDAKKKGDYNFHANGVNEDAAFDDQKRIKNKSVVILEINGVKSGNVFAEIVFENETLQDNFKFNSSISVKPRTKFEINNTPEEDSFGNIQ